MSLYACEAFARGTRYSLRYTDEGGYRYILAVTGWGDGCGEWIRVPLDTYGTPDGVHWSYLEEKMPELTKREGDKEGWVAAFRAAGIDVFG